MAPKKAKSDEPELTPKEEKEEAERMSISGGIHVTYNPRTGVTQAPYDPYVGDEDAEATDEAMARDAGLSPEAKAAENYGGAPGERTHKGDPEHEE